MSRCIDRLVPAVVESVIDVGGCENGIDRLIHSFWERRKLSFPAQEVNGNSNMPSWWGRLESLRALLCIGIFAVDADMLRFFQKGKKRTKRSSLCDSDIGRISPGSHRE